MEVIEEEESEVRPMEGASLVHCSYVTYPEPIDCEDPIMMPNKEEIDPLLPVVELNVLPLVGLAVVVAVEVEVGVEEQANDEIPQVRDRRLSIAMDTGVSQAREQQSEQSENQQHMPELNIVPSPVIALEVEQQAMDEGPNNGDDSASQVSSDNEEEQPQASATVVVSARAARLQARLGRGLFTFDFSI